MKKLNREKVIRMVGGEINNRIGISSSGGSGGGGLAGAATQAWVDANYVSIEFFDRLFQAYEGTGSSATRVNANDTESTIDNIKAMFGFWTDQYLSALGQGSGGGGGGGAEALSDLLDVELTTLQNGQALIYSSALGKWTNGTAGVNMTQVWSALDSATNEQINVSHLTNALSGYVTTSAISDMATKTWVGQQGYATQTWVNQNFITIAFFDRLFQAYEGTGSSATRVNPNDTTSTIDNIKAMFGFWTELYLSALGDGGASSGSISLGMLSDVVLSSPTDGQALIYDATLGIWKNGTVASGVSSLSALSDVTITSLQANQALVYNATAARWENTSITTSLLSDFVISSPATHQVLMYDASTAKWYNLDLKTINGLPIYGSGDIQVGGGSTGNYLPISGGTMTGEIRTVEDNIAIQFRWSSTSGNYNSKLAYKTRGEEALVFANKNAATSFAFFNGLDMTNNYDWYTFGTPALQIKNQCVYINKLIANNETPTHNLFVNGNARIDKIDIGYSNEINSYDGLSNNLHLNYRSAGTVSICFGGGNCGIGATSPSYKLDVAGSVGCNSISITNGGRINVKGEPSGSTFFIGNSGNQGWVRMQDICGASGKEGDSSGWTIRTSGNALFANVQSNGYVTALSDARHKTIINPTKLQVEQIARMPAVLYRWNDGRDDNGLHVGSIAQDWQRILPEVVMRANDKEGTLSMQYGVAALVSSIITARKVVEHERRIKELERENKELKLKLKIA